MINTKLLTQHGFTQLTCLDKSAEIHGVYIGDLLSWVMSHAHAHDAWISVIGHVNAVAVAILGELACLILVEDAAIAPETIDKAQSQGLIILTTNKSAYQTAILLNQLGV